MRLPQIGCLTALAFGLCACTGAGTSDRAADPDALPAADAVAGAGAFDAVVSSPDAEPLVVPDSGAPCATAPTGDWTGQARVTRGGSHGGTFTEADLTWTLASTSACVDTYQASGTVTYRVGNPKCVQITDPETVPLQPGDATFTIDRTTAPPTYRMTGASAWSAMRHCEGDEPEAPVQVGDTWAQHGGAFDGAVIDGVVDRGNYLIEWHFTQVDAVFTPPGEACSEPAATGWTSTTSLSNPAVVSWTRVSTTGCVDRFAPSGTASRLPSNWGACVPLSFDPSSGTVAANDGYLTINRSTDPPTFFVLGYTEWPATRRCTYADGSVRVREDTAYVLWAEFKGAFDGDQFAADVVLPTGTASWSFTRVP